MSVGGGFKDELGRVAARQYGPGLIGCGAVFLGFAIVVFMIWSAFFCATCGGSGKCINCKGSGRYMIALPCPMCFTNGKCSSCGGSGRGWATK